MTNEEITEALLRCTNWNQGTIVPCKIGSELDKALQSEGVTGRNGGLTRKGSIAAEKAKRKQEAKLFGF